ncbi:septal ring lytic transglycosylase RlpA family protein [Chroococcidiopsis sp. CCALA 051]|uniref:septal ring lytic transglycosylase RlpA family protein n=1 Tax=Chroococcidiopsis sp. CCALA 051 TaxID=869949 RepID=UPI000D0CBE6E|nr:septal ring lytic transglycosylase RlpA family protein [Chroococcidiopsis sp. CCALA 051]MBE9018072.1 septal ring lytic transglycosylase RlpA family protein [Chroococcidiopsidales cyanobacterium LEGE 13417]PSM50786.1 septal ring lytic transglycosylase RlpA family protein [Chroococcidiopsis sp. CCALA 051]
MKKQILLTTVALLTTAVGVPLSCYAESLNADSSRDNRQEISSAVQAQPQNVEKVGETQSRGESKAKEATIARIQPHERGDRQAVTLYVRNIPVLTFLGDKQAANATKVGQTQSAEHAADKTTQVATTGKLPSVEPTSANNAPIWQAAAVAARLNQISADGVDASKITVKWNDTGKSNAKKASERYEIAIDGKKLVAVDADTRLPEQNKKKLSDEALQATNRLRRLLGNAPPLKEVAGMPEPKRSQPQNIAFAPVRAVLNGVASWYGPGFHGNRTANGETYNQNALTAAHKSLPFGTRVRVTHAGTGRSIVVRINDRGPYIGGRIIDLSAAAARVLGMAGSGVAPVRVEILGR